MSEHAESWRQWAEQVLSAEGLTDWRAMLGTGGPYCWTSRRIVEATPLASAAGPGIWLHEIAHALRARPGEAPQGNDKHDGRFADLFTELANRWWPSAGRVLGAAQRVLTTAKQYEINPDSVSDFEAWEERLELAIEMLADEIGRCR